MLTFEDLDPRSDDYATRVVDRLLSAAVLRGASDIHVERERGAIRLRWRIEGVLVDLGNCPDGVTTQILARIKALARLITYRHDVPQEGRLAIANAQLEARVGTLPTLHGERAVIRLSHQRTRQWLPAALGMPADVVARYIQALESPSGVILITGTAGSGKTTTAYAGLRHILQQQRARSLVSLEDPIEAELPGVSQSQINPTIGYTWTEGLKALLRQDPEVMLVGEIRDAETASVVFQSAMTGQLVVSTMHARSASDAVRRLMDLQVPVHHLRCALDLLICQRLVVTVDQSDGLTDHAPREIPRRPEVELLPTIEGKLAQALQELAGSRDIERAAVSQGMQLFGTSPFSDKQSRP